VAVQAFQYLYAVGSLLFFCVMSLMMTVFAGSIHQAPGWMLPFLVIAQALPILGFVAASIWRLHVAAESPLFMRLSLWRRVALGVLIASWCVLILRFILS
jgi:hypothetical protein